MAKRVVGLLLVVVVVAVAEMIVVVRADVVAEVTGVVAVAVVVSVKRVEVVAESALLRGRSLPKKTNRQNQAGSDIDCERIFST